MFKNVIKELSCRPEVEAITLGGSRATKTHDELSDYDVYVYLNKPLTKENRVKVIDEFCSYMEYGNDFWELEDDGELKNGIKIEFIYRDLAFLPSVLDNLFVEKNVNFGYTTCFYDNLIDSEILYDPNSYYSNLVEKYKPLHTNEISLRIIQRNVLLLKDCEPALFHQVKKAVQRNDLIAVNHRITELFAIIFDILFALNNEPHPGEKRMVEHIEKLQIKPNNFSQKVNSILLNMYHDKIVFIESLSDLIEEIILLTK